MSSIQNLVLGQFWHLPHPVTGNFLSAEESGIVLSENVGPMNRQI